MTDNVKADPVGTMELVVGGTILVLAILAILFQCCKLNKPANEVHRTPMGSTASFMSANGMPTSASIVSNSARTMTPQMVRTAVVPENNKSIKSSYKNSTKGI